MKNVILFLVVFLAGITISEAQIETCDCQKDLDFIIEKIKKMPSYKKQVKGEKAKQFEDLYNQLSSQMVKPLSVESCYKLLLQQMTFVNDVHTSLSVNTPFLPNEVLENDEALNNYKQSELYLKHPKTSKDLSALRTNLLNKKIEEKEGIYNLGDNEKIGIYLAENKKDFIGVLLETDKKQWQVGEIRFYLYHTSGNKYNMYFYDVATRTPRMLESVSFENGRVWSYKKVGNTNNYEFVNAKIDIAEFKQINENTQYLYFATFGNSKSKELKSFIKKTLPKLNADNVIVDLRSNTGGNSKYSEPFAKALKNKNVYVITNSFTGSNGEQLTLQLLKNKKAKHLGQTTRGVIAYGKNYGYYYNTPSGHFQITPTDMNFHKFIAYEGKGVTPEISLDFDRDWIEQTLEIIEKH